MDLLQYQSNLSDLFQNLKPQETVLGGAQLLGLHSLRIYGQCHKQMSKTARTT